MLSDINQKILKNTKNNGLHFKLIIVHLQPILQN